MTSEEMRNVLLEIRSALKSLTFAPPETAHIHMNRIEAVIDEALAALDTKPESSGE